MLLAALILSMPAHADVVGPAAANCPSGFRGTSNHRGAWCVPATCDEQACEPGATCETTRRCVREETRPCEVQTPRDPCTVVQREVFGPCETDTDCAEGTCVMGRHCVESAADGAADPPTSSDGGSSCGCSTGAGASMVFLLRLLPLAGARRRQR